MKKRASTIENDEEEKMTIPEWAYTEVARTMHKELCDCGDRDCTLFDEIYTWLIDGNQCIPAPTIAERLVEWQKYAQLEAENFRKDPPKPSCS